MIATCFREFTKELKDIERVEVKLKGNILSFQQYGHRVIDGSLHLQMQGDTRPSTHRWHLVLRRARSPNGRLLMGCV
eukprot:s1388_g2.t1